MFYADGANSFSRILDRYFELVFAMGADGIFHECVRILSLSTSPLCLHNIVTAAPG
jgi:hypothetical protein